MIGTGHRFVCILRSESDSDHHYVGMTSDVENCLESHNHGPCGHTQDNRPWSLAVVIEFPTEQQARRFERYLKPDRVARSPSVTSRTQQQDRRRPPLQPAQPEEAVGRPRRRPQRIGVLLRPVDVHPGCGPRCPTRRALGLPGASLSGQAVSTIWPFDAPRVPDPGLPLVASGRMRPPVRGEAGMSAATSSARCCSSHSGEPA
jgi:predicted GIY-YIG superfamily endonuclease